MSTPDPLQATDPRSDASVHASAGTGKTWLLVTRVLRLLLAGTRPDGILAVTFTRKAAAEMEQRIMERLRGMALADNRQRAELLKQAGIATDADTMSRAAQLYENLLCQPHRLHCTTFHAFCNELLARFPLEAGITPGFELIEKTGQLERAAYDALLAESIRYPRSETTAALDRLAVGCENLESAKQALFSFLGQRSDWWAWTSDQADPPAFADAELARFLEIDPGQISLAGYPDDAQRACHRAFAELLRDNTKTDAGAAHHIEAGLEQQLDGACFLAAIQPAYLTREGKPRKRKASPTQQRRLGPEREARFLTLHEQGCDEVLEQRDIVARYRTLEINRAWYRAGMALLDHYQSIKRERRLLDLTDLEWQACRLLNRSEHAYWVQYKLDARIDHLLVDEFQDTNPTQWQLLLPLLRELAAGDNGRERSVFLVGDRKQSIYRFRRANPALLETASAWLEDHRAAGRFPLNLSRRSAPAIMECVNRVFTHPAMADRLAEFDRHGTHLEKMYGRVELLPLCSADDSPEAEAARDQLRNPLHEPRSDRTEAAVLQEARLVAHTIRELVTSGATAEKDGRVVTIGYSDIMILLRQRTHAAVFEQALRDAGIPCLGASRGLLLEQLEVRDLVCLLECLVTPYDNLALAQVLRSPLFGLDSEQLLPLAEHDGNHWYSRLQRLAREGDDPYHDIHALLSHWRTLAGQLPVHDLLDRIFHEGEVLQRYTAAFPVLLHARVKASFTRFIELALELDNGRYPSLPRFLDQLNGLRQSDRDQPDELAPDATSDGRVSLMTVHAAKGLEAPVVFIVDAARVQQDMNAWQACVDWPHDNERPRLMLLAASKSLRDSRTSRQLDNQAAAADTEDANLLYVALTRARQYLFVSGSAGPNARNSGWYGALAAALEDAPRNAAGNPYLESNSIRPADEERSASKTDVEIPGKLSAPIVTTPLDTPIAPSRLALAGEHTHADTDGRERGNAIHLMLERLTTVPDAASDALLPDIANRLQRDARDAELLGWWDEARTVRNHPAFRSLFDPAQYKHAWSEVPVQYLEAGRMVHGIIDRLIVTDESVLVVDYKTHRNASTRTIPLLTDNYRAQLDCYARAAALLWPNHDIRACLLFTVCPELVWPDGVQSAN